MRLLVRPGLIEEAGNSEVKRLAERIAPLESPLRLGAHLTVLNGHLMRQRIGKRRFVYLTRRAEGGEWELVLVAVVKRDTGDETHGEYRNILDRTAELRDHYRRLADHEDLRPLTVPGGTVPRPLRPVPDELLPWIVSDVPQFEEHWSAEEPDEGFVSFIMLDEYQRDLLEGESSRETPRFLTGRAGSSKSTVLQYLFARYVLLNANGAAGEPRFVTRSERLVDDTRERLRQILSKELAQSADVLDTLDRCVSTTAVLLQQIARESSERPWHRSCRIDDVRFRDLYRGCRYDGSPLRDHWSGAEFRDHRVRNRVPWGTAWYVLRALIRGYDPADELDQQRYARLPKRDQVVPVDLFDEVYRSVRPWYAKLLEQGFWDDQDLARAAICSGDVDLGIAALVIDEAQDLTRLELLALIGASELFRYDVSGPSYRLPVVLAGDQTQSLHMTGFRWEAITAGFYELTRAAFGGGCTIDIKQQELTTNYRCVPEIVAFANTIQAARHERFGEEASPPQDADRPSQGRSIGLFIGDGNRLPGHLSERLRQQRIILPCAEGDERDYVLQDPLLKTLLERDYADWLDGSDDSPPLIYTADELKGLEYRSVTLYGWGAHLTEVGTTNDELAARTAWARLYVAVTRAMDELAVIDAPDAGPLWQSLELGVTSPAEWFGHDASDAPDALAGMAEETRAGGLRVKSGREMRRAAALFAELEERTAAEECHAFAARFDQEPAQAAMRFVALGNLEEAVQDLYVSCDWEALVAIDLPDHPAVQVARLLTSPTDPEAVTAAAPVLAAGPPRCGYDEPETIIDDLARAVDVAARTDAGTTGPLIDVLASQPDAPADAVLWTAIRAYLTGSSESLHPVLEAATPLTDSTFVAFHRWLAPHVAHDEIQMRELTASLTRRNPTAARALAAAHGLREDEAETVPLSPAVGSSDMQVGAPWEPVGATTRWKLSAKGRITTRAGDQDLADVLGEEAAAELAAAARQLRRNGGRILMDVTGALGIYVPAAGGYRYVGTASQGSSPARSPSAPSRRPSSSRPRSQGSIQISGWPRGSKRYVLQARDIRDPATDQLLSKNIGAAEAATLARELVAAKGATGRIYVAPDGRVATRVGEAQVVIADVANLPWFTS